MSTAAPLDAPTGPAGWHGDPWQRHALRYFDGHLWTEHVADGGVASVDSSPVADLPRSRPQPARGAPPEDPVGARVLPAGGTGPAPDLRVEPLLLVAGPGPDGARTFSRPDDVPAGRAEVVPPALITRMERALVVAPSTAATRVRVTDAAGAEVLGLLRPKRRTAPVVDVAGPDGPLGTVVGEVVLRDLRARVVGTDGGDVGLLTLLDGASGALAVTTHDGTVLARLTSVWDIPGDRRHLPPGVLLLDRRPPAGTVLDPARGALLLGAVLAPTLLRPPAPPTPR